MDEKKPHPDSKVAQLTIDRDKWKALALEYRSHLCAVYVMAKKAAEDIHDEGDEA